MKSTNFIFLALKHYGQVYFMADAEIASNIEDVTRAEWTLSMDDASPFIDIDAAKAVRDVIGIPGIYFVRVNVPLVPHVQH